MPREAPLFTEGLSAPPVRRYAGPIVDCHTHTDTVEVGRLLLKVAGDFGVRIVCGIARLEAIDGLKREFGDAWRPIVWTDHSLVGRPDEFTRQNVRIVREAHAIGAVAAKFWFAPRFMDEHHFRFDNPALGPVFETLSEFGMAALVHIGDPDCWFAREYADRARWGTKASHYEPLENTLAAYPNLKVQGAHFGGDPEDVGHLGRLLDRYPNYTIDSSATKWVARVLSAKPADSRAFVIERADRIVFGSDLVAFAGATPADYASRYWVHRWLWEGDGVRPSPIPDPCVPPPQAPQVHGLNLPDDVLAKLYTTNAQRLLGLA